MPRVPKPWYREDRQAYFVTIGGVRHNLGSDKKAADKKFHELMATDSTVAKQPLATASPNGGMTVAEVFDKYLDWCQKHRSPRTYEWTQKHIQQFCDHLGKASHSTIGELRPFHIVEWVDTKTTWGDNQKRGAIIAVQRPFSWALKLGYIDRNPVAGVEKPKAKRRDVYVTTDQFGLLMERYKEGDPFRDLLSFLWETGCRPQEARHLELRHYHTSNGRFEVPRDEAKGKRKWRIIRLTATAKAIVDRRMPLGNTKVFENEDGNPWTADAINCRFQRLKRSKGLSHFAYALRHGFATRKLTEGHDHLTVAEIMGHSSGQMLATVYSHIDQQEAHLQKAVG